MTETSEISASIIDGELKDSTPMETVARIQSILKQHGIDVVESWFESGVPYCYSNKYSIPGTTFRTIGKGLTKEFAIASGYGEMIERLQVGFIYGPTSLKDGDYAIDDGKSEYRPAKELLAQHPNWYQSIADIYQEFAGEPISPEQILQQCSTEDGIVPVNPYFDLCSREKVYFPTVLRKRIYGSNGCAAGNTPEEALVQAISEVVERGHMLRTVQYGLALPEVPDEELKKYKVAYEIISFVRQSGFKVIIKDASLDTGFPVVCACIIDGRTGRYHTHFGAHPVFEIALERSLTESFQGRDTEDIATNEDFTPKSDSNFSLNRFYAELRRSCGDKLPTFFVGESQFTFDPDMGVHSYDNKEILRYCKGYFEKLGHSVLVRDCSCLGFPTYQVIVPGYSECYINRICSKTDDQRYSQYAIKTFRDPAKATLPDMLGTLMHLNTIKDLDKGFMDIHRFCLMIKIPSTVSIATQKFLYSASLGYIHFQLGHHRDVASYVDLMIPHSDKEDKEYLICLKRYSTMKAEGYAPDYIREVLDLFHSAQTVEKLYGIFQNKENPLAAFVLHCDKESCETCQIRKDCYLKNVDALAQMLDQKMQLLDFDDMADHLRAIV